jgi:hypothetical protein
MKNQAKEKWAKVKGDKNYRVSTLGRVKSVDRTIKKSNGKKQKRKGKLLKIQVNPVTGYMYVALSNGKRHYVHRLVLEAFLPNPNPDIFTICNHKNGNKLDCRLENLEYSNYSLNMQHSYDTGLRKCKISDEDARFIVMHFRPKDKKFGAKPLAKRFGVSTQTIYRIAKGLLKTKATRDLIEIKKAM